MNYRGMWIIVSLLFVSSCSLVSPVQDIDRVQPNFVKKQNLEGEWYTRAVVVDKQYSNASLFIGSECELDRVKFEITKNLLNVYRSYEKAPGTEGGNVGGQTLVAQFSILKHFDRLHDYNPINGQQNNVVIENDFDKPWEDREYVRVDWSKNLVKDFRCNDMIRSVAMQNITRNSGSYPKDLWRVRVTEDYIETTIDAVVRANPSVCSYIGDWNCTGSNVKMKFSFMKIDEENTYQKMEYPDYTTIKIGKNGNSLCFEGDEGCQDLKELWMYASSGGSEICDPSRHDLDHCRLYEIPIFSKFGYFRTERNHYDREKGYALAGREQLINRWNIWQKDIDKEGNSVILPLAQRTPKPIIYYLNAQFPVELREEMQNVANDWSVAFSDMVAQVKNQCTVRDASDYVARYGLQSAMKNAGFAQITRNNLTAACQKLSEFSSTRNTPTFFSGNHQQIEERYGKLFQIRVNDCNEENVQSYIQEHNLAGELAKYGISDIKRADLEETCAALEWVSEKEKIQPAFTWQQLGDLRYSFVNWTPKAELAGPLGYGPSARDPLTGEIINANANIYGASLDTYAATGADMVERLNGNLPDLDIINASHFQQASKNRYANTNGFQPDLERIELAGFEELVDSRAARFSDKKYLVNLPNSSVGKNWDLLRESGFEDRYLMSEELTAGFLRPDALSSWQLRNEAMDTARPSFWAKPFIPNATARIQDLADKKNDSLQTQLRKKIELFGKNSVCFMSDAVEPAVAELAASLKGKSRAEAYNYIRKSILGGVVRHEIGHTLGLRHNFEGSTDAMNFPPDFWDVDTHDHRMSKETKRKSEMQYSSIMDYLQRFNGDFAGIGLYDKAAIKFGYAQLVEVFDETKGEFVPREWFQNTDLFHYRELPYLYSGDDVDVKLEGHYNKVMSAYRRGDRNAKIDIKSLAISPNAENFYKRKYIPFSQFRREVALRLVGQQNAEGSNYYEVPYKYCSDSYAFGGSVTCNLWDMGVSAEEIVSNAIQLYDNYYLFNNFRRDKLNMSAPAYMSKLYSRTYQPMLNTFRYMYYYRRSDIKVWPLMQDWTKATYMGLNFFGRVLQTVEPGRYCFDENANSYSPYQDSKSCNKPIEIGLDQGRYYNNGYSNDFFYKTDNIGHMYDKLLAMQALTDNAAFFTRDFTSSFSRGAFSIGYYRLFAPEMTKLFSNIVLDNSHQYAARVEVNDGNAIVKYQPLVANSNLLTQNTLPTIEPSRSWMMRYYGLVFPMLNYSSTVDSQLDFAKRTRISLVGSRSDPTIEDHVKQVMFTNPHTKHKYRALAVDDENLSLGYQLVQRAKVFVGQDPTQADKAEWKKAENTYMAAKKEIEAVNKGEVSASSARLEQLNAALEDAEIEFAAKNAKLSEQIQIIEMARQLGELLEFGR